ncbi:MAG: PilN domain-containing protein [Parahaliea sp.]
MLDHSNKWQLFGFDMQHLGRDWRQAWAEFLWGEQSPLRPALDGVVRLSGAGQGDTFYQAGAVVAQQEAECRALLLPDELVLLRQLNIPLAADSSLPSVLALEVHANSPFPADDTRYGWLRGERSDTHCQVCLAIVSTSATMRYLGSHYDVHDPRQCEVWAQPAGGRQALVLRGFGEEDRLARYRRRLLRLAGWGALAAVAVVAILALAVAGQYVEMRQYQALNERLRAEAGDAAQLRTALLAANETVDSLNTLSRTYPSPHVELARLTRLLGDDAHVTQLNIHGDSIRLRGRAVDAASVLEKLTAEPHYAEVTSPQAITRVGNTNLEQFYLDIRVGTGAGS